MGVPEIMRRSGCEATITRPLDPRLRRQERLGATPGGKPPKRRDPGYTGREVAAGAGWLSVGAVILAGVMTLTAVGAGGVLYFLGWLLDRVLVVFPAGSRVSSLPTETAEHR